MSKLLSGLRVAQSCFQVINSICFFSADIEALFLIEGNMSYYLERLPTSFIAFQILKGVGFKHYRNGWTECMYGGVKDNLSAGNGDKLMDLVMLG